MSGCGSQRAMERTRERSSARNGRTGTREELRVDPADMELLLRREFFTRAAASAARYGVTPDRLIEHALTLRTETPLRAARLLAHLDDLTHATACIDQSALAWSDLVEMHELVLIHVCAERLGEAEGIVHVRRFLACLRNGTIRGEGLTMAAYSGQRPLRHWLAERAMSRLAEPVTRRPGPVRLRLTAPEYGVGFPRSAGGLAGW